MTAAKNSLIKSTADTDAFIVAGGLSPWLKDLSGTEHRCLVPLGDKRIIDYIIEALQKSGCIRRIVIAAHPKALPILAATLPKDILLCKAEADLSTTTYAAANALGIDSSEKLLGVCDDIPLLTPQAVRDFLAACNEYPSAQLYYPIIPKKICLKEFPQAKRTYANLKDDTFTGGNMMLMSKNIIPHGQKKAREIFILRKSPLKLCLWLGWSFIFKFIFRCLTVANAETRTSELLEINCKAIITHHVGIGMDIDKASDLLLAEKYINNRKEASTYGQSQKN